MARCNEGPRCAKIADPPNARNGKSVEIRLVVIAVEPVSIDNGTVNIGKSSGEKTPQARFPKSDQVKI